MKRVVGFLVLLALAVGASASVDLFFTSSADPYGLRVPSLAFLHAGANGTDYRDGYELTKDAGGAYLTPPLGPLPDAVVDCSTGQWAYVWGRFNNEPPEAWINGVAIRIEGALPGVGNIAWYLCNNVADPNIREKRWDGDSELFYMNPPGLIAITAYGIPNANADVPWDLYAASTRTFLLGAVKCPTCPGELTFVLGQIPIHYKSQPHPAVNVLNKVVCVPEPTTVLLLALASAVFRRR